MMYGKLFLLAAVLVIPAAARADQIDTILKDIQAEKNAQVRIEMAFQQATPVGDATVPTVWNVKASLPYGEDAMSSKATQSLVWHTVQVGGAQKDRGTDGARRRAVGIVIKNNGIHIAEDGPNLKLEQFWMAASTDENRAGTPVRVKSLENKQVDMDSIPFKSAFAGMLDGLEANLNVIANFYGTYDLHPCETRVFYLAKPQYVDYVQVKAMTMDNTPNYSAQLDVRILFE